MSGIISRKQTKILKGIAISAVVVQHIGQAFHIGIVNPLGPLGVFLFLFLSGYGMSCSYEANGRKKYFQKKLIKVYLPYCFTVMLFLIWMLSRNIEIEPSLIGRYLILWSLPQGSYWYLVLMFYWYVVFYLLTFCYDNDKILVPLLFAASALIIILQRFSRVYVWQFFSFPMGVMYAKHSDMLQRWNTRKFWGGGTAIISGLCMYCAKKDAICRKQRVGYC